MRLFYSAIAIFIMLMGFGIPTASALDNGRIDQQLLKLDPKTRLEQTCDTEVMFAINRSENAYNVDKVIAYTFEDTIMGKNQIKAPGAAFRSRGKWSRLSYSCATGPRHLNARTLHYKIGSEIPRDQWRDYNLYD